MVLSKSHEFRVSRGLATFTTTATAYSSMPVFSATGFLNNIYIYKSIVFINYNCHCAKSAKGKTFIINIKKIKHHTPNFDLKDITVRKHSNLIFRLLTKVKFSS